METHETVPILTADELSFVEAVEKGTSIDDLKDAPLPDLEQRKKIRAEVLVRVVLGEKLGFPNGQQRSATVKNSSVRLWGAKIIGEPGVESTKDVHLENASQIDASPLPRLRLEGCWFEGEIHLERSHFRSLSFRRSQFSVLNASDANIDGPVDLTGVRGIGQDVQVEPALCGPGFRDRHYKRSP